KVTLELVQWIDHEIDNVGRAAFIGEIVVVLAAFAPIFQSVSGVTLGQRSGKNISGGVGDRFTARLGIGCAAHECIGDVGNVVVPKISAIDRGKEAIAE